VSCRHCVLCIEMTTNADKSRYTSLDGPESRTHQSPLACRRDPVRVVLRSPIDDEVKENVEPRLTQKKRSSPKHWSHRLPTSKMFTVTGCPRTADRSDLAARRSLPVSMSTEAAGAAATSVVAL